LSSACRLGALANLEVFITTAIAIHNIPEGLAICLVLIPRGTSVTKASLWSIFTSLPQPLMAVPAYIFVLVFEPLLPIGLGFVIGALSAILGVGGGFIMVPAMIYLLGMPTVVTIGTSSFHILFVAANVTILQAITNHTVDVVLAMLLILGGIIGTPIGSRLALRLPGFSLRGALAVLILAVATELLWELLTPPSALFSLGDLVK